MLKITELSQLDLQQTYSYADYLNWHIKEAIELIKGKIMLMSPAPNAKHQAISMNLSSLLHHYFKHNNCRVYAAPFDVRLYNREQSCLANTEIHTVVQPDLCVICNPEQIDTQGCMGAPEWIIEILSKGNAKRDIHLKYTLYQESGVAEYWLVYPDMQAIHQFILDDNGLFQLKAMYTNDDMVSPHRFPDLAIDVNEIFDTWNND
ncbi:MAG: Uma2 family endonuclease [Methylovulum sp.]|jgi:Uma2 family endonuclease|nr:Uma2 family endonuclease [Methylovulum sp.]MCF7999236.1 Uma2 family endonuclease [Methylovulum sp.]